ncbi:M20 metallopeptidase family protein [Alkaliphilus peptidifermentans]|uniref:Hippurate hydrolase n=1 Tax=Alkaliphilus peptidifermentans DSM 18978 TaxID=1120976 RepID=A0A1G5K9P8_9FIRM|nr:M20 family metallopeptidase [Alkaliphilus peptidifermentans]SCY96730.1 hippurate hydrolase [Alkaliphilus peptidifermentans DSM 18978]
MILLYLSKDIQLLQDEIRIIRRELHQIPELAFEEYKTAEYIKGYLNKLKLTYHDKIAGTGIIVLIQGTEGKKTIGFRADMDALTVEEENEVDYKSIHKGKMHACGHDGHQAILLGLAKYLVMNKEKLRDNVVLIFQPAEEGPGGALPIVSQGYLKKYSIDEIYGLHLFPEIPEGKMGVRQGPMMSQTGEFDITIHGKGGHGAMPHNTIDSVVVSAQLITGLQAIASRSINPIEPVVLTIGKVVAGEIRNVIASEARLEGTIRSFKQEVHDTVKERITDYVKGLENIHNCKITLEFRDMYPAVTNDSFLTSEFIQSQESSVIQIIDPIMLAEDFSYYQKEIPGVFFFLGSGSDHYYYPLHNSRFNYNEKILGYGVQAYLNILKQRDALEN